MNSRVVGLFTGLFIFVIVLFFVMGIMMWENGFAPHDYIKQSGSLAHGEQLRKEADDRLRARGL